MLLITIALLGIAAQFKFLSPQPKHRLLLCDKDVTFNCTTNDPNANTTLLSAVNHLGFRELKVKPGKLTKNGSVFILHNVGLNEIAQRYKCRAVNDKGTAIESQNEMHVFPGIKPGKAKKPFTNNTVLFDLARRSYLASPKKEKKIPIPNTPTLFPKPLRFFCLPFFLP